MTGTAAVSPPAETQLRAVLDEIKDPCSVAQSLPMGLCEMGLIRSLSIDESGRVAVELRLTSPFCEMIGYFKREIEERIAAHPGVSKVEFSHDSGFDWDPELIAPQAQARRRARLERLRSLPPRDAARGQGA